MSMPSSARFQGLHKAPSGFVMPNAWDAGSALILVAAGFSAIATTSAGIAFSMGKQDYAVTERGLGVSLEEMLERMGEIARAVPVPVNGDLEAGFGDSPEDVARTIRAAIDVGLAGGNIEDKRPHESALYDIALADERIVAARETIDSLKSDFVLTARSDALIWSEDGLADAIARSNRYREAGADCLFTPGTADISTIETLAREINGPLNMVMGLGGATGNANDWLAAGVQRISLGGAIARTALAFIRDAARELHDKGTISFAEGQMDHAELNALFAEYRQI